MLWEPQGISNWFSRVILYLHKVTHMVGVGGTSHLADAAMVSRFMFVIQPKTKVQEASRNVHIYIDVSFCYWWWVDGISGCGQCCYFVFAAARMRVCMAHVCSLCTSFRSCPNGNSFLYQGIWKKETNYILGALVYGRSRDHASKSAKRLKLQNGCTLQGRQLMRMEELYQTMMDGFVGIFYSGRMERIITYIWRHIWLREDWWWRTLAGWLHAVLLVLY